MCRVLKLLPAAESERGALYGLDPLTLAQLALKDASKIAAARADWSMVHLQQVRPSATGACRMGRCIWKSTDHAAVRPIAECTGLAQGIACAFGNCS